jgi:putative addiction module component (TIGR02574 family)
MPTPSHASLLRLPPGERLALAEQLWLSVADERRMPVPQQHKQVLRKRVADYREGRSKPITHEEMLRRLKAS